MSYAFTCRPEFFDEGVLRYGFHGLSYESLVHRLGDTLPGKAIFAHLGNGASVTAVLQRQVDRHQHGLTPTGGIPMGTRSGDLDTVCCCFCSVLLAWTPAHSALPPHAPARELRNQSFQNSWSPAR